MSNPLAPNEKVLVLLCAHADDTEFFAGGTIARFAAEGWTIHEVIATDNGRGSFELTTSELIAQSREKEARAAAKILGKQELIFLNYPDGYLCETPHVILRGQLVEILRRLRPQAVLTFDPWAPYEWHPDHKAVAAAAIEALNFCQMPLFYPEQLEQGLKPVMVPERYFFAKHPNAINKIVDVSDFIDRKIEALLAHDSQMKMMVDELRISIEITGLHEQLLALLDRDNVRPGLEMLVRMHAEKIGQRSGYKYGEEFRYELAGGMLEFIE